MTPLLSATGLGRVFGTGRRGVVALDGVSITAAAGELVAVTGRSGSGKTTLLNCLGGLDRADSGRVLLDGQEVTAMSEEQLLELRRSTLAYVFQGFALLPILSAAENVGIPLRLRGVDSATREARVAELLDLVGLSAHANHRPDELSGGQQQRVALARALAGDPRLLLADEPTGQLDSESSRSVMQLLHRLVVGTRIAAVVTTHDRELLSLADRVLELRDGRLVSA